MNMDVSRLPLTKRPLRGLGQSSSGRIVKKQRGRPTSVCGVCGDEAKHIHFGGLCCPSCKAFFRRVVQLNLKDSLTCSLSNNCTITVKNRRDCPTCRFRKCESIGMLFNWVMPEEERKRMMERRNVATKRVLGRMDEDKGPDLAPNQHLETGSTEDLPESSLEESTAANEDPEDPSANNQSIRNANETTALDSETDETERPKIFERKEIFIKQEIKVEEELLESPSSCDPKDRSQLSMTLSEAFLRSDFPTDSSLELSERFPQLFFWYCQALSVFFHNVEDLKALKIQEKSTMIKHAVTRSIFLYSAHQFDNASQTFPKYKLNTKCSFPTIKLEELELFVGNKQVFLEIKSFLATSSGILEDEYITLYLMIVSFLTNNDSVSETAIELKRKYCEQFEDYLANQTERNNYKSAQYYYDILEDVDKLAKVFGEMKLPADKIVAKSSFQNLVSVVKLEPEELNISDTVSQKADRDETLKTIVQIDHDYSMSITLEESIVTSQPRLSQSIRKNKAERELSHHSSWKLKQHRNPFYQKSNKPCNRPCCSEDSFHSKRNLSVVLPPRHLECQTYYSPEYQRHMYHMSSFETAHHVPERTVCPPVNFEEYLPNHLSRLEDNHLQGQYKCFRKHQCCPVPTPSFQRYEPIWDNCGVSHHRWPQHYHPTKESRACCHIPWNHVGGGR